MRAFLQLGGLLLRGGMAAFSLGLVVGGAMLLRYFHTTPFGLCTAASGQPLDEVWPWAVPLVAAQTVAIAAALLGIAFIAYGRRCAIPRAYRMGDGT